MTLTKEQIANLRVDYSMKQFDEKDLLQHPIEQFSKWFEEALEAQVNEPNAMTLATVKHNGAPGARIVLMKDFSEEGFTFYTNYNSHKGEEMLHKPAVALVFCWLELHRQVRVEGVVEKVDAAVSDAYFYSRPLGSQLGALVSPQSQHIPDRAFLEERYAMLEKKYTSEPLKRPEHWGGYLVRPTLIEFWQGRTSRLHDRFVFEKNEAGAWTVSRLAP